MSLEPRLPEGRGTTSPLPTADPNSNLENLKLSAPLNALEIVLQAQREALSPAEYLEYLQAAEQRLKAHLAQATEQSNPTLETIHGNVSSALSSTSSLSSASKVCLLRSSKLTERVLELPRNKELSLQELITLLDDNAGRYQQRGIHKVIMRLEQKGVLVQTAPNVWKLADRDFKLRDSKGQAHRLHRHQALRDVLATLENWVRDNPRRAHAEGKSGRQDSARLTGEYVEVFLRRTYLVGFSGGYRGSKAHTGLYPKLLTDLLETTPHRYFQTLARSIMNDRIADSVRSFKAEVSLDQVSSRMNPRARSTRVTASDLQEYLVKLIVHSNRPAQDLWNEVTGGAKGIIPRDISGSFKDIILDQCRKRAKAACAVLYEDWALPWRPQPSMMRYIQARLEDQMSVREVRQRYNWKNGMYSSISHETKIVLPALADLSPRMLR